VESVLERRLIDEADAVRLGETDRAAALEVAQRWFRVGESSA